MKRKLFACLILSICFHVAHAQKDPSLSLDPSKAEWFKEAKFGMFIHWGLYSILEGSYHDMTMPEKSKPNGNSWYAEWIQARLDIPNEEYQLLARQFNPVRYDADAWVKEAKNAGMRYIVITAKHHEGFALWKSKVSDFDMAQTPYHKDLLEPLVKACKKYGMKYGFYYSHWQDWEHEGGALPYWKPKRSEEEFEKYWQEKSLPQVKELIVKYDPDLLWFDTWNEECHINPARRDELIRLIRTYSKKCLVNGRISFFNPGENIDYLEMNDNEYPKEILKKPWQTPATMQHSWGYHAKDYNWKSADEMLAFLVYNISKGGNYLLNIGPKADGTWAIPAVRRLREMGAWLHANGEAVYGTQPISIPAPPHVYLTQKETDGRHYLYIFLTRPVTEVSLPLLGKGECRVVESGMPVKYTNGHAEVHIEIPERLFKGTSIQVLKMEMATPE